MCPWALQVLAANLSHSAIAEGLRLGRTVVKMYGPQDPMVVLVLKCASTALVVDVGGWCPGGGLLSASVSTGTSATVLTLLRNNGVEFQVTPVCLLRGLRFV